MISQTLISDRLLPATMPVGNGLSKQIEIARGHIHPSLVVGGGEFLPIAFDYQIAAVNMLRENQWTSNKVFVTSPSAGDGKTSTAFNLAWALSRFEKSVLLVELNFTHPQFCTLLGDIKLRYGLDSALRGSVHPAECVFSLGSGNLHVAAVRDVAAPGSMHKLVTHLSDFFDWATDNYDMLVFDCPAVASRDWDRWFHKFVGTALLVVREQQTPVVQIDKAVQRLGSRLKGVLLNSYVSLDYQKVDPATKVV